MEGVKTIVERMTGRSRPDAAQLATLVRERKANEFRFADDGFIPNHPRWPLIVYRDAVSLPQEFDPAAVFEGLFERHGWGDSWRNGVFDYPHYHSRIHEVLGVARGSANIRFGGERGRTLAVKAGDVAVLPAGTGISVSAQAATSSPSAHIRRSAPTTFAQSRKTMRRRCNRSRKCGCRTRIRSMAPVVHCCSCGRAVEAQVERNQARTNQN